jgi:2-polyprenyl-6-methoxyphenol hydroxylase-like FAD-dependent oxidoreductase
MVHRTALIVGAGIGGLAAGVALQRAGWRTRIFERASSPREVGFALNLAANAMVALEELGLADPVLAGGHRTLRAEIRRGDGRVLKRVHLPDAIDNARAIVATRPVLHGALLEAVGAAPIVLGSRATGFESGPTSVTVVLADGRRESGDVLIGADGVASAIRRQLHPGEGPPRVSGYCALRGVVYDATHLMGDVSAATYLTAGVEGSIAQAGSHAVYWYMSVLAREVPEGAQPPAMAERFGARLDEKFRAMVRATRPEDMRFDPLVDRDPIDVWGQGAVTLLGDAAHPMLPHTGQGAAQALEDAIALGLALTGANDIPAALRRYERVRAARTRRLVQRGRRAAWATTTHSRVIGGLRTALIRAVPAARMAKMFMLAGETDPHRDLR